MMSDESVEKTSENQKWRIVCYLNQFFGQLGGEEKADVGFLVKEGPIGPALLLQSLLEEEGEVVATVICGDNYIAENLQEAVEEGLKIIADLKPSLFFSGLLSMPAGMGLPVGLSQARSGNGLQSRQ